MRKHLHRTKGQLAMSRPSVPAPCRDEATEAKLGKYRAKSAAMVHKASGDPEQVCKDGLAVFDALSVARERANKTANEDE
jgi:hypothetical protein